jgi:hypothetical protein
MSNPFRWLGCHLLDRHARPKIVLGLRSEKATGWCPGCSRLVCRRASRVWKSASFYHRKGSG